MAELVSDLQTISRRTGLNMLEDLIYPAICLDSMKMVTPLMLVGGEQDYLLARAVEKTCLEQKALGEIQVVLYHPYFLLDKTRTDPNVFGDLADALAALAGSSLVIHEDLPVKLYKQLRSLPLQLQRNHDKRVKRYIYRVLREQVKSGLSSEVSAATKVHALELLGPERSARLYPCLDLEVPDRFDLLDRLLEAAELVAVVTNSPLDIQELTGVPAADLEADVDLAWYAAGGNAYVLSPKRLDYPQLEISTSEPVFLEEFFRQHSAPPEAVGLSAAVPLAVALSIGSDPATFPDATAVLRQWREERAVADLFLYILCAQATRYSSEGALAYARERLPGGQLSEREVYNRRLQLLVEFQEQLGLEKLGLRMIPYFVNLHGTSRTLYPAVPSQIPLARDTKCLRLDCGVLLTSQGFILACSDVGRSLVLDEDGAEWYRWAAEVIARRVIPALEPGKTGAEIHALAVGTLASREKWAKDHGLLDSETNLAEVYQRDVGHLLGRQEPSAFAILPNQKRMLHAGLVGSIEMPWLYGSYALGYEDMFVVGLDGGINITVAEGNKQQHL